MNHMFTWSIGDLAGLVAITLFVVTAIIVWLFVTVKQALCKHERVYENRQCHAICRNCGRDLGFIGKWRDHNLDEEWREK